MKWAGEGGVASALQVVVFVGDPALRPPKRAPSRAPCPRSVHGCRDIGPDYAVTLRAWRKVWEEKKDEVRGRGVRGRAQEGARACVCVCLCARLHHPQARSLALAVPFPSPTAPCPPPPRCWRLGTASAFGVSTAFTLPTARLGLMHATSTPSRRVGRGGAPPARRSGGRQAASGLAGVCVWVATHLSTQPRLACISPSF